MNGSKKRITLFIVFAMLCCAVFGVRITSFASDAPNNTTNLTVGGNIVSHYYIDAAYYKSKGCDSLSYTYNGMNDKAEYNSVQSDLISLDGYEEYVIDVEQAAAQIAEPTVITIYNDNQVFDTVSFSSKTYCDSIIGMTAEELSDLGETRPNTLISLCKSIVAYGKSAQAAFKYSSDTVAGAASITDDYSDELNLNATTFTPSVVKTAGANVKFKSASFICTSSAKMRFYISVMSETDSTVYGEPVLTAPVGTSLEKGYVLSNGVKNYYLQVNNIKPVDFDEKITVEYAGASVTMSVLDYAGAVINSNSVGVNDKTLAKAIIVYNSKANNYFDAHNLTLVPAVSPTCTDNGSNEYYLCSICNEMFSDENADFEVTAATVSIPALGHTPAEKVEEITLNPTCTEAGTFDEVVYCSVCNAELSRNTFMSNPLGHDFGEWAETTAPTCTENGVETRTCSRCNASETRNTDALGHNYSSVVTAPTCTQQGYTTYTCSRCNDSYTGNYTDALGHTPAQAVEENRVNATCTENGSYDTVVYCFVCNAELSRETTNVSALGHDFGEWAETTAPTCTENGVETRTCSRCNASETRNTDALGHNYSSVVTAPTCTQQGYTTYTCSRCNNSYTDNVTTALGHAEASSWTVQTAATLSTDGTEVKTCTRCGNVVSSRTIGHFTFKLPNTDFYIYRVGNSNNVTLGTLFDSSSGADITNVSVTITNKQGSASGTYTANSSDWRQSTLKFSNTGVVTVTLKHGNTTAATLNLEVVSGTNKTSGALSNTTSNIVLLGDVTANRISIYNKAVVYGNGFTITDARTDTSGASGSYITMYGGSAINNAVLMGQVYPSVVTDGTTNEYYAPGVWVTGDANIYNSYVSEAKNAIEIKEGTVNLINTTVSGGCLANIQIGAGELTLENCVTQTSDRNGLKGLAIRPTSASCKINILGTLTQYNWLKSSDLPSTYSSVLSSVYNDSTYAYTYNGTKYVNMGIFFMSGAGSIYSSDAQAAVNDQTGNNYGFIEKTYMSYTGTVYTAKATMGSADMLASPEYSPRTNGQYFVLPAETFDYTTKNYIAKVAGDNNYCYYDTGTKTVQISFDKTTPSTSFSWDPMILSVTKNGNSISNYTVKYKKKSDTSYTTTTNTNISFAETGDYEVVYTYTDPYNYDKNGNPFDHTYSRTVNISVSAVEPDQQTYYAAFAYTGAAGTYEAKQVIGTDNKTYVMPDVSATSTKIGSTTVGGKTVYYPIVTVPATSSNGNTAYSSGKGYYFAPVFSELNITDYNQDNGAVQYTYNSSSTTWPHSKNYGNGPDSSIFGYASGAAYANQPYGRSMDTQYYGYGKNNYGLCYTSKEIEKNNDASTHLVQYHYVSNDGTTYYFYIKYSFGAMTYSSCVTDGTLVTMADGSHKAIEDVNVGDMVMTWSMWNGCYEAQPVTMAYYHGEKEWDVLTLEFSDGTEVRMIQQHGFFDVDKNNYVYITPGCVEDYIGDRFVKQLPDGSNTEVTLTGYTTSTETVGCYSLQTAYNENFMVEDMLSMTGEDYVGRFEYFDIGEGMKYDEAKMQADIERYGLYTYEDFSDYLTPMQFDMFNGKYFKILVGKGVMTYDDIINIIHTNLEQ